MSLVPTEATTSAVLQLAERGVKLIAEANDVAEARDLRSQAWVIEELCRERDLGTEAEHAATALRLRAERRIGQLLPPPKVGRPSKKTRDTPGISEERRREYRQLAKVPDDTFEKALDPDTTDEPRLSRRSVMRFAKQDSTGAPVHPARYSDELVPILAAAIRGYDRVLDPFAGTGRIHEVGELARCETVGIEIEPEWARRHPRTSIGDALDLQFDAGEFDAICTSPTYGNRLADHHNARDPESRRSYTHDLGRALHVNNSGALQWGAAYREFHERAWAEAWRVLRDGGRFVLNISDHIRDGERQPVAAWHLDYLCRRLGGAIYDIVPVDTRRLRAGANAELRPLVEYVILLDKPEHP